MSDENKTQPTPPPVPVAKTSAVPLKKETVRITLRARPGAGVPQPREGGSPVAKTATVPRPITTGVTPAGAATARVPTAPVATAASVSKATAPIQLPSAPLPPPAARVATTQLPLPAPAPAAAPAPSVARPRPPGPPSAPRPPGSPPPAPGVPPTIPLAKAPAGPKPPPGAPSVGLPKPPPGARVEAGASTVPLAKAPGGPKPPGAAPAPAGKAGPGPTQQLPKATVQLAKSTVPASKTPAVTPPSAPVKRAVEPEEAYEEKDPEAGLAPLAIVCMLLAIVLAAVNVLTSDIPKFWSAPNEDSFFLVPQQNPPPWEEPQPDGTHKSTFNKLLDEQLNKLK